MTSGISTDTEDQNIRCHIDNEGHRLLITLTQKTTLLERIAHFVTALMSGACFTSNHEMWPQHRTATFIVNQELPTAQAHPPSPTTFFTTINGHHCPQRLTTQLLEPGIVRQPQSQHQLASSAGSCLLFSNGCAHHYTSILSATSPTSPIRAQPAHSQISAHFLDDETVVYDAGNIEVHKRGLPGQVHFPERVKNWLATHPKNSIFQDFGCGTGQWTCLAAEMGIGTCLGMDIQPDMIGAAKKRAERDKVSSHAHFVTAGIGDSIYRPGLAQEVLSCLVACNLPSRLFNTHVQEMGDSLKGGGECCIVYPHNLDVVFTGGKNGLSLNKTSLVINNLQEALTTFNSNGTYSLEVDDQMMKCQTFLKNQLSLYSATFYTHEGKLTLLQNASEAPLQAGQKILRVVGGGSSIFPNYYYPPEAYLAAAEKAQLSVISHQTPCFSSQKELQAYNQKHSDTPLGDIYQGKAPFGIIILKKN